MITKKATKEIWWNYRVLDEIEKDRNASQRDISSSTGIALGYTNQIIKRLVRKGLIKTSKINAKRVAYYLTPTGFSEKINLVVKYAQLTVSLFRCVREIANEQLRQLQHNQGVKTVSLVGTGELAEAVFLSIQEVGLDLKSVYDTRQGRDIWFGYQVHRLQEGGLYKTDVVVVTEMMDLGDLRPVVENLGHRVLELRMLMSDQLARFAERVSEEDPELIASPDMD